MGNEKVRRYVGWEHIDGTSERCEVIAEYKAGDEKYDGTIYVLASDYDALAAELATLRAENAAAAQLLRSAHYYVVKAGTTGAFDLRDRIDAHLARTLPTGENKETQT